MIKGYCHTNLDDAQREKWPTQFAALPRVGDCVKAESGRILKIYRVVHYMENVNCLKTGANAKWEPQIAVEIHKIIGG